MAEAQIGVHQYGMVWSMARVGVPVAGPLNKTGIIQGDGPRAHSFAIEPNPVPVWKMVVDTAKRQP